MQGIAAGKIPQTALGIIDRGKHMTPKPNMSWWSAGVVTLLCGGFLGCQSGETQAPSPAGKPRKTIGKTTQNVLDITAAKAAGGIPASMEITGTGLEVAADAYRTSVGKMAMMAVEQRLSLYQAQHGDLPRGYDGFIREIIQPGEPAGLQLPMLPYYQEYAYDPATKKLVVMEFPEKKKQ
jgi:hypothetical protein